MFHLGHVEPEDEIEGQMVFTLVCINAEPLESLFCVLIVEEYLSVEEGDKTVEEAIGKEGSPDALVDAPRPEEQDPVEAESR